MTIQLHAAIMMCDLHERRHQMATSKMTIGLARAAIDCSGVGRLRALLDCPNARQPSRWLARFTHVRAYSQYRVRGPCCVRRDAGGSCVRASVAMSIARAVVKCSWLGGMGCVMGGEVFVQTHARAQLFARAL